MVPGHPYSYFTLLRVVVFCVALHGALSLFARAAQGLAITCLGLALLFQPLFKVHLGRDVWIWADLAAAVLLLVVGWRLRK